MFKAILATASILVGCLSPVTASETVYFDPTDWKLSCGYTSDFFAILESDNGVQFSFHRTGTIILQLPNEEPKFGHWLKVPQSPDVVLSIDDSVAVIENLYKKDCDATH